MDTNWQMDQPPAAFAGLDFPKELKLKLSLETRNRSNVIIVHCQGRIVYRDEAAALARVVGQALQQAPTVVVDLSGVNSIDSAGIGELALLQTRAQQESASLKYAGPTPLVSELLELTNLDSVLELHPTVDAALATFHNQEIQDEGQQVCADR
jgi:anti-sigma B factor antagonist